MREIAAASDFDFVALEPRRPKKKSAPRAAAKKPSPLARLWRFRIPLLGGLAMIGLLGGIVVNAMFLQHGRHPAPLLGGATVRLALPAPPPRPAAYSPLLNDQIPRPALQKVEAAPEAAFAAPTAALDDSPADSPDEPQAASLNEPQAASHKNPPVAAAPAPASAHPAPAAARPERAHQARDAHATERRVHAAARPSHSSSPAHGAKKPDPIAALLSGEAR